MLFLVKKNSETDETDYHILVTLATTLGVKKPYKEVSFFPDRHQYPHLFNEIKKS